MFRAISLIGVLFLSDAAHAFSGEVLKIPLQERTQFTLKVVPNLGTRLLFPFLLDDPELKPPLNYKLVNTGNFAVTRDVGNLIGQNVFLITSTGKNERVGKLYMSIAGYNLAINLIVSNRIPDHISDVYLELSEEKRNFLINHRVETIRAQLREDYERRLLTANTLTNREDLALLMLRGVRKRNIKQMFRGGDSGFKTADVYLDHFLYYPHSAYGLHFWVEHYGKKFSLAALNVRAQNQSGSEIAVEGRLFCFDAGKKLDECIYLTKNDILIKEKFRLQITMTADNNEIQRLFY